MGFKVTNFSTQMGGSPFHVEPPGIKEGSGSRVGPKDISGRVDSPPKTKGEKVSSKKSMAASGTEERKKQYDEKKWKYDDTIKGYNRDGSKKEEPKKEQPKKEEPKKEEPKKEMSQKTSQIEKKKVKPTKKEIRRGGRAEREYARKSGGTRAEKRKAIKKSRKKQREAIKNVDK